MRGNIGGSPGLARFEQGAYALNLFTDESLVTGEAVRLADLVQMMAVQAQQQRKDAAGRG